MTSEEAADNFSFDDINFNVEEGAALIEIDRPEALNSLRGQTVDELIDAFHAAWADDTVRGVILTGAGDKAFCAGGDVKTRAKLGNYGPTRTGIFRIDYLHRLIRDIPKPVIAAVNGVAIGGGHVIHVLCDMSIASSTARFGQAGPRVGSFDAGFGASYLARVVGEKRAREIWFLCRQYDAATALSWGLVNAVVEPERLLAEARKWVDEIGLLSPTAIEFLKHGFNADTEGQAGLARVADSALQAFGQSPEAREGLQAFLEKRTPDFRNPRNEGGEQ